jgi:hypothetical protein
MLESQSRSINKGRINCATISSSHRENDLLKLSTRLISEYDRQRVQPICCISSAWCSLGNWESALYQVCQSIFLVEHSVGQRYDRGPITATTKPSMISQTAQTLHIQKPFNTSLGSRIDSLHNPLAFEHRFPACFARFIYSETH